MKRLNEWCVLAVDDEPDNLNIVVELMEFQGAKVLRADSGHAALALLQTAQPDIILLDLFMPEIDGWAVQRHVRANPKFDDVPIVALTALVMPNEVERVWAAKFDGYIPKPFRVAELLVELQQIFDDFHEQRRKTSH